MPWEIEHAVVCEVMHWLFGFLVGAAVFLFALTMVHVSGMKKRLNMSTGATFLVCLVPAACMAVITHVLEDYWIGLF